jgi:hypothetical protein
MEPGVNGAGTIKAMDGASSFTWIYDYRDYWAHKDQSQGIVETWAMPLPAISPEETRKRRWGRL